MSVEMPLFELRFFLRPFIVLKLLTSKRFSGFAAAVLVACCLAPLPAAADEFDPLLALSEARELNDEWQACAAAYVKPRLRSRQSSESLAKDALDKCKQQENKLRRLLAKESKKKSVDNVIELLREKYRSNLSTVIDELRKDD